jgi:hypothetical protein
MSTDPNNQEAPVAPEAATEKVAVASENPDYVKELQKRDETIGSMKRELKDLRKALEPRETPNQNPKPEEFGLVQKSYLRAAGIAAEDEVELALSTAKKWGVEIDKLVDDEDFKIKLDKLRTQKSNALATANIPSGGSSQSAKSTAEYWISKGTPPSRADVPDRKTRATIIRAMMDKSKGSSGTFYND